MYGFDHMSKITNTIYITLFILLLAMPHFSEHVGNISRTYVEWIGMLVIFGIAYLTYLFNQRELHKQKRKVYELEQRLQISGEKLLDSFKYIGAVNRKLPLFKNLSSDLLNKERFTRKYKQNILESLLSTAVTSVAKAERGMFRFVEIAKLRTTKEIFISNKYNILSTQRIGNKDLIACLADNNNIKKIGDFYIVPASDRIAPIQNFLIFVRPDTNFEGEYFTLQAITDQAQLFYKYLSI